MSTFNPMDWFDLLSHDLLVLLEEPLQEWITTQVVYGDLGKDDTFHIPDDEILLVLEGTAEVRHAERMDRIEEGNFTLGIIDSAVQVRGDLSFRAVTPVKFYRLSKDALRQLLAKSPGVQSQVQQIYTRELRRMYREQNRLETSLEDFFIPGNAGMIPGPYEARNVGMYLFVVEDDRNILHRLLPRGLRPIPYWLPTLGHLSKRYLVVCCHFREVTSANALAKGKTFDYHETTIFLPCLTPQLTPGMFCPELYPDSYLAIALGRELYGFPKRFGRTFIHDQDQWNLIHLSLDGRLSLRAQWKLGAEADAGAGEWGRQFVQKLVGPSRVVDRTEDAIAACYEAAFGEKRKRFFQPFWPDVSVLVHRQVPKVGPRSSLMLEVDELVQVPFHLMDLRNFRVLEEAELTFYDDRPGYTPHRIAGLQVGGTCLGGFAVDVDMQFSASRVLKDYNRLGLPGSPLG